METRCFRDDSSWLASGTPVSSLEPIWMPQVLSQEKEREGFLITAPPGKRVLQICLGSLAAV